MIVNVQIAHTLHGEGYSAVLCEGRVHLVIRYCQPFVCSSRLMSTKPLTWSRNPIPVDTEIVWATPVGVSRSIETLI